MTSQDTVPSEDWSVRVLHWFSTTVPVVLVALVMVPFVVEGGTVLPWQPMMPDLLAMTQVAQQMLNSGEVFGPQASVSFRYTPFGALLVAPFALSDPLLWQVLITVVSVSALQDLLRRLLLLDGAKLVAVGAAIVVLVEPVRMTLGVGQLGLLLVWLVVIDLVDPQVGHHHRRLLPQGTLTGIAGGVALTPLWVPVALLLAGRRRVALTGVAAAVACLVLGWLVMPGQSEWLLETRDGWPTEADPLRVGNQSFVAGLTRFGANEFIAQVLAVAMALLVVWAAGRWWRQQPVFALGLAMVASLLPHNPAPTWEFVCIVVLAAGLALGRTTLPLALQAGGWLWIIWAALALPQVVLSNRGAGVEWGFWDACLAGAGALLWVMLVAVTTVTLRAVPGTSVNSPRGLTGAGIELADPL